MLLASALLKMLHSITRQKMVMKPRQLRGEFCYLLRLCVAHGFMKVI